MGCCESFLLLLRIVEQASAAVARQSSATRAAIPSSPGDSSEGKFASVFAEQEFKQQYALLEVFHRFRYYSGTKKVTL